MSQQKQHPIQGTVEFIQHNLPGLEAGEYQLTVSQDVSEEEHPYENQYHFTVQAPRFSINPDDIYVTYPPDQTQGEYTDTLAHVVFTKQTLPWMRFPTLDEPPFVFPDGQHDHDVPTWLAVLIFDEDDEKAFKAQGFSAGAVSGKVKDLFFKRPPSSGAQGYSYFYAITDLDSSSSSSELNKHLDYGQSSEDTCAYLDIPMELFWKVAPSVDDLKMMAHVRNVNITRKATQNGVPASRNDLSNVPGTSNFSVVIGNRLPQTGKRCVAHLVSLEAMAPFLPVDPATSDSGSEIHNPTTVTPKGESAFTIDKNGFMRLVSLTSWSFTSTGTGKRFEELLLDLKPKDPPDGTLRDSTSYDFSLGLPVPPVQAGDSEDTKQVKNALEMGYTALGHHTRDAGETVSWFRGPLLPYLIKTDTLPSTFTSADAATSYNPDTGLFDISYSAAWQMGQLLALQNKHFSVALYNWRRHNLRNVVAEMEALLLSETLDEIQQNLRNEEKIYQLLKPFLPSSSGGNGVGTLSTPASKRAAAQRKALASIDQMSDEDKNKLEVPFLIYTWLAKLKLLEGVPFHYLVPDERMLPPESIRFFYVDVNWLHALLDGALSIGRAVTGNAADPTVSHDKAVKSAINDATTRRASVARSIALGTEADTTEKVNMEVVSGFILRSEVVQGWPGLEVNGYTREDGSLMDIVRFERLAPTVLLCLFELNGATLGSVDIHEPAEGLHFGVADTEPKSVNIRYNFAEGNEGAGHQVPNVFQDVPFRSTQTLRTLRLFRLSKDLHDQKYDIYIKNIYSGYDHLPSSEFALQMVKGVGLVSFNVG